MLTPPQLIKATPVPNVDALKWRVWRWLPVVTRQCFAQMWPQHEELNLMKATGISPNDDATESRYYLVTIRPSFERFVPVPSGAVSGAYGRGQSQPSVPPTSKA
jgi:hypothetical protein